MTLKNIDLICLSHLRWGFVFQRPQHLMSRFAPRRRVFFFEEPLFDNCQPHLRSTVCPKTGVRVNTPVLPRGLSVQTSIELQKDLLHTLIADHNLDDYIAWYYTPMARQFTSNLRPIVTVYDCMDELSAFAGAPPAMRENEQALFRDADLVFTGGASLFEAKRKQHPSVHLFPSGVDVAHFARARFYKVEPEDQSSLPRPRLGYAGVIDERMDLQLIAEIAAQRPQWQLILLGPVAKINPASLPRAHNIHYLGMKAYDDLPDYLSGWNVGMLPFALNESTRFISPTKTPEYLAAGLRVISTPIRDVVTPYGNQGLVSIATGPSEFIRVAECLLKTPPSSELGLSIDSFLAKSSWDKTWSEMDRLVEEKIMLSRLAVSQGRPSLRNENSAGDTLHV
ncbi:MAG TPA: glycosyltransferase family 1 protein [Bryobacteraceae bacterium]|nr:glycosyltransferase family 1 protein [Bryobacteraceae bacterium]